MPKLVEVGDTSSHAEHGSSGRYAWRDWLLAVALGLLWFCANNLNIVRAQLQAPPGTRAVWMARETDMAQHLTWVNAMRDGAVVPNYHMPAETVPGVFCGLTWLLAQFTRAGIDASLAYGAAQIVISVLSMFCLIACLRMFVNRSQYIAVFLIALATVTPRAPLRAWSDLNGGANPIVFSHVDGFFEPGPLTNATGTLSVWVALLLTGRYAARGRRRDLYAIALVTGLAGLFHPFEVFTIMAASSLTLLVTKWPRWRPALYDSLVIGIPGILSITPYIYNSLTVPWMRLITETNSEPQSDLLRLLFRLGVPVAFVLINLVTGPRLHKPHDIVLQCWFAAVLLVLHMPTMPFRMHAANGMALITGLLAVRQIAEVAHLRDWISQHRQLAMAVGALCIGPAVFAHGALRYLKWRDALNPDSTLQFSAVSPQREVDLIRWFRENGTKQDVVLAGNPVTSWMLASTPVRSVASHWLFSGSYVTQCRLRDRLYQGNWTDESAREFLDRYGITHVVVPDGSPLHRLLSNESRVASFDSWTLYQLRGNRLSKTLPDPEWDPFGSYLRQKDEYLTNNIHLHTFERPLRH